jgi:hypothetical protein
MPVPELLYAQVVKRYRRWRIVGVKHGIIFGPAATIKSILAKRGWKINTAFAERLNLDFRQHVAAIGRRVNMRCKQVLSSCCPSFAPYDILTSVLPHT